MLDWREEPIGRDHDRKAFDCGSPELNDYLRRHARQNHEGGGSKTFVAVAAAAPKSILGYSSISPASIAFTKVPAALTKGLGRYEVAVFRLARLAVALPMQGQGLGGDLLLAAGARALAVAAQVGGVALAIDAKDKKAAHWYERFGAMPLLDSNPLSLILPFKAIVDALEIAQGRSPARSATRKKKQQQE
ncbi:GNAT family N-acetyltransferase [Nitrobacter sp. 62-23]|uniref:GNAT family N-acetyltransferase n=1 Tax=Nitrobacter sp. 62-23 TaxID=1895798 RepID=UPI000925ECEF|nr:GNAT family N-acetyltransferase [Nitrobacter sp. 62-23]OJU99454.1 MAG: GNAT family N-acetyltransferase [Nitrobacter sp. 62-23]